MWLRAESHLRSSASLRLFDFVSNGLVLIPAATLGSWHTEKGAMFRILAVLCEVGAVRRAVFILVRVCAHSLGDSTHQTVAWMVNFGCERVPLVGSVVLLFRLSELGFRSSAKEYLGGFLICLKQLVVVHGHEGGLRP